MTKTNSSINVKHNKDDKVAAAKENAEKKPEEIYAEVSSEGYNINSSEQQNYPGRQRENSNK